MAIRAPDGANKNIVYDSFGVRAAKVDGILHLTGGWSNSGDSDLVPIMITMMVVMMMMMIVRIIVLMMVAKLVTK